MNWIYNCGCEMVFVAIGLVVGFGHGGVWVFGVVVVGFVWAWCGGGVWVFGVGWWSGYGGARVFGVGELGVKVGRRC